MKKITVNFCKTVSFDVDAQNGFTPLCPNELPVPDGDKIVEECNKNATKAKFRYMSKDAHPSNAFWNAAIDVPQFSKIIGYYGCLDLVWNSHCVIGTEGFKLIDGLPHPSKYHFIVYKGVEKDMHPYSPIYHDLKKTISTGVIEKAKQDGIDTFIVGGLALNSDKIPLCVGHAAIDLAKAGFRVILNLGATRGIGSKEGENKFIKMLIATYKVQIVSSADEIESAK